MSLTTITVSKLCPWGSFWEQGRKLNARSKDGDLVRSLQLPTARSQAHLAVIFPLRPPPRPLCPSCISCGCGPVPFPWEPLSSGSSFLSGSAARVHCCSVSEVCLEDGEEGWGSSTQSRTVELWVPVRAGESHCGPCCFQRRWLGDLRTGPP